MSNFFEDRDEKDKNNIYIWIRTNLDECGENPGEVCNEEKSITNYSQQYNDNNNNKKQMKNKQKIKQEVNIAIPARRKVRKSPM